MKKLFTLFVLMFAIASVQAQLVRNADMQATRATIQNLDVATLQVAEANRTVQSTVSTLHNVQTQSRAYYQLQRAEMHNAVECAREVYEHEMQMQRELRRATEQQMLQEAPQMMQPHRAPRAPINEFFGGFEGTTGNAIPEGWTRTGADVTGTAPVPGAWVTAAGNTPFAGLTFPVHNGTRMAASLVWGFEGDVNSWLFTPAIEVTAGVTYEISFWYRIPQINLTGPPPVPIPTNHFRVAMGTGPSEAEMNMTDLLFTTTEAANEWAFVRIFYTPTTTREIFIGFNDFSPAIGGDAPRTGFVLLLDDVSVGVSRENDLQITATSPAPFNVPGRIPGHQIAGLPNFDIGATNLGATAQNIGTAAQSNVTLSAVFGGNPVGTFATHPTLAPQATHTFVSSAPASVTLPATLGAHTITYTVGQTETDGDPTDNVATAPVFTATRDVYRKDELVGTLVDLFHPNADNFYGHVFTITEQTILDRVYLAGRNQPAALGVWPTMVSIFRLNTDGTVPAEPIYRFPWIISANAFTLANAALPQPVMLTPGSYFVAMTPSSTGEGNRQFLTDLSDRGSMMRAGNATTLTPLLGGAMLIGLFLPEEVADVAPPTAVNAINILNTSATITWASTNAYRVTVFNTATGEHAGGLSGALSAVARTLSLTGLTRNTEYTVRVVNTGGVNSYGGTFAGQRSTWIEHTFTTADYLLIDSTSPAAFAEDVALDASVVVTFAEPITLASVEGITFVPAVTGVNANVTSGNILTITHGGFAYGTIYRITISADAIAGNFPGATWTFTTEFADADFPDPFDLAVAVVADRATLTWEHGEEDETIFEQGFNAVAFPPIGWTNVDQDGDGRDFWTRATGVGGVLPYEGAAMAVSRTWAGDPGFPSDNWLITPNITLPNNPGLMLSFVHRSEGGAFLDHLEVLVSNTGTTIGGTGIQPIAPPGTTIGDFTSIYRFAAPGGVWTRVNLSLADFAGEDVYIAFRHIDDDMSFVLLDDISITMTPVGAVPAESFNIFLAGNLVATDVTEMQYVLTGLLPGEHIAGVQAVGPAPESYESNIVPIMFTVAPPAVATRTPGINAVNVGLDSVITVVFNHEVITAGTGGFAGITFDPPVTGIDASIDTNTLTITHNGFEYGTIYTITIPAGTIAFIDTDISWQFRTVPDCDVPAIASEFEQGFEPVIATVAIFPPDCWTLTRENEAVTATWVRNTVTPRPGSTGHARHPNGGVTAQTSWLITKAIAIPNDRAYKLSFWDRWSWSADGGAFSIWISTETTDIEDFVFLQTVPVRGIGSALVPWEETVISLADFSGETVYIAFRAQGTQASGGTGNWTAVWDVDDVSIRILAVDYLTKSPYAGEENVLTNEDIVVVFNQTITQGPNFADIAISPTVAGFTPSIVDDNTLLITHNGFENEVTYTVTIPVGAILHLEHEIEWEFTVTTAEVIVLSTSPADGTENVEPNADIMVTFNQPVTVAGGLDNIVFVPAINVTSAEIEDHILTITHSGFAFHTEYTVTIPAGTIEGLDEAYTWTFTTIPLTITARSPLANARLVPLDEEVTVTFSHNITVAGDLNNIVFDPVVPGTSASIEDNVLTITHGGFAYETLYTVIIPAGTITGFGGDTTAITWTFTTEPDCSPTFPIAQDFELTFFPPDCWTLTRENTAVVTTWTRNTTTPRPGSTGHARHPNSGVTLQTSWMITQAIEVPATGVVGLRFWDRFQWGDDGGTHSVWVSTETSNIADFELLETIPIRGTGSALTPWEENTIMLGDFAGETIYIAFRVQGAQVVGGTSIWTTVWDIDDISIVEIHANDLEIIPSHFAYTQIPVSQATTFAVPSAQARNIGSEVQTNVTLSATLNATPVGTSEPVASIAVGATSPAMVITEPLGATTEADQTLVLTVAGAQANQGASNTATLNFTTTENVFAVDTITTPDSTGVGFGSGGGTFAVVFEITETTMLSAVQMLFGLRSEGDVDAFTASVFRMTSPLTATVPAIAVGTGTRQPGVLNVVDFSADDVVLHPGLYAVALTMAGFADISFDRRPEGVWYNLTPSTGAMVRNVGGQGFGSVALRMVIDDDIPIILTAKTPAPGATNVAMNADVKVTFLQEVVAGDLAGIIITYDDGAGTIPVTPSVVDNQLIIAHDGFVGEIEYTVSVPVGAIVDYEAPITWTFTTAPRPEEPFDLYVEVYETTATFTWSTQEAPPVPQTARITLTAGDVWGDGSGYQMWLDNTATLFGTVIPAPPTQLPLGCAPFDASVFSHRIPTDANVGCFATATVIMNSSATIDVEAGIFDFMIVNPDAERIWIAGGDMSRQDNFTFEAGIHYTFTAVLSGNNDRIDLTTAPISGVPPLATVQVVTAESFNVFLDGVFVENVTDTFHVFTDLEPNDYIAGVQAVSAKGAVSDIVTFPFTIGPPFAVVDKYPAIDATDVALDANVTVTFNRNITATETPITGITFDPPAAGVQADIDGMVLTITHGGFAYDIEYTITIPAGTIVGYNEVITWSFTTVADVGVQRDLEAGLVTIYPNPVDDILHISTTELVRRIEILNLQGTLMMATENIGSHINVSHLPAGVYVIRFITETGVSTQRFVKR